jgi:lactate dehydrogenase-like 2-hydroxyacid dehydrogenase
MNKKILVTRRWPESVEAKLNEHFDVTFNTNDVPLTTDALQSALKNYDAILPTVTDNLNSSVFEGLNDSEVQTRIIANYGVGFSHIDLESAKNLNITVTNTPDVLSECTADIAIMLMLMVARRAGEGERELRSGSWSGWCPTHMIGHKVTGSTLGIIGFGRIGRETAKRALSFGMQIKVYNRSKIDDSTLNEFNAVQVGTLYELAESSDFVSLHCPGGASNTNLIDLAFLKAMKRGGYLINTARGEVVDEEALVFAIKNKLIAGAGLDVFCNEPKVNESLLQIENVVLLPHLGSASKMTREAMGLRVLKNITHFFNEEEVPDLVC